MGRRRVTRWAAALAVTMLALAACGSGRSAEEQVAIQQAMDRSGWTRDLPREQRDCVEERLRDSDLDPERVVLDASATDDREQVAQHLLDCVPRLYEVDSFVQMITDSFEQSLPGNVQIPLSEGRCFVRRVIEGSDRPARMLSAFDRPEDADLALESMEWCFGPDTMAAITGTGPDSPTTYGDDPTLDDLHDECVDGDDRACDLLFWLAPEIGEYADTANDCGGRGLGDRVSCSPEGTVDASGVAPEDSVGAQQLRRDCGGGDLMACDLLYWISPFGSDNEEFGFTCGGRLPMGGAPTCRTALG